MQEGRGGYGVGGRGAVGLVDEGKPGVPEVGLWEGSWAGPASEVSSQDPEVRMHWTTPQATWPDTAPFRSGVQSVCLWA